jgi:hypothetical protein
LFWNSLVSVFLLLAFAGLFTNLLGPLPNWFPAPGLQNGKPQMNGQPMDLGTTLFLFVFLIPFVLVGVLMTGFAIMNLVGKVEVALDQFESSVSTGIGFLIWRRRFDCNCVHAIRIAATPWQRGDDANECIELSADRTIKFGSFLATEKKEWMRAVVKELLLDPTDRHIGHVLPKLNWIVRRN